MIIKEPLQTSRRNFLGISVKGALFAVVLQVGFPFRAAASAPKELVLTYDAIARKLTVRITHSSAAPGFHYIEQVDIKKEGKTISSTEYKSQPDQATFSYVYPLEAAPGDVLEVKAICSILGSKTEKLTVKAS